MDNLRSLIEKYFSDEITLQEREALREWILTDPAVAEWFENEILNSGANMDEMVQQNIYESIVGHKQMSRHTRRHRMMAAAAAVIALVSSLVTYLVMDTAPERTQVVASTDVGDRSKVVLPDGTQVILNTISTVTYEFDNRDGHRIAHLSGEAYFKVAHDTAHPFSVVVDKIEVECKGTEFNVKAYDDDEVIAVTLADGAVNVHSQYGRESMLPGTMVTFNKRTKQLSRRGVLPEDYSEWTQGNVRFRDATLGEIAKSIEREYGKTIIFESPELRYRRFTGHLEHPSLNTMLEIISLASDLVCIVEDDNITMKKV